MRFATEYPALLDVMYSRKHGEDAADVRAASDACAAILLRLFASKSAGLGDPERFGVVLLASLHGIAGLAARDSFPPGHDPDNIVVDLVHRLLRG